MSYHMCSKCGTPLRFCRNYKPEEFLEGQRDSTVWIIGLNPRKNPDWVDERTAADLQMAFDDGAELRSVSLKRDPFFHHYCAVSNRLYHFLGKPGGVAHTDLVKCSSESLRPVRNLDSVVSNCLPHLGTQLRNHLPQVIVCNGIPVAHAMANLLGRPSGATETSYVVKSAGREIGVVNSGFVGRLDRFSKARLGRDVDTMFDRFGLLQIAGDGQQPHHVEVRPQGSPLPEPPLAGF